MSSTLLPAMGQATVARTPASARATGGTVTLLVHLLLLWALMGPIQTDLDEEPAALPPMKVSLMGAPSVFATPAPLEAVPSMPELSVLLPEMIVRENAPPKPVTKPDTQTTPPAVAMAAPASAPVTGAGPQLRRSNGKAADCQLPGWLMLLSQTLSFSQRYPAQARQLGETGTAYIRLSVARNGAVMEAPLLRSSGHASLDYEARDVIRRVGRFAPVPKSDCVGYDLIVVDQPIHFGG